MLSVILKKLFSLCLCVMYFFTPYSAPSEENPIDTLNSEKVRLVVAAFADSQISNYMLKRDRYLKSAGEDLSNSKCGIDALLIAGDIAENGLQCEYDRVYEHISNTGVKNYILSVGNHDVRLRNYKNTVSRFTDYVNKLNENAGSDIRIDSLNYSAEINGYHFLVLGTDRTEFEESYLSESQLQWLDSSLSIYSEKNKPVFVMVHQTFKNTHGLPGTWNSPFDAAGTIGKQSEKLFEIMNKYQNVIMITGHLHTGIGEYTYEKIGNIHSVNLPSITIDNKDGVCNDNGIGFMIEVYDGEVIFRARNFSRGEYIKDCDFSVTLV